MLRFFVKGCLCAEIISVIRQRLISIEIDLGTKKGLILLSFVKSHGLSELVFPDKLMWGLPLFFNRNWSINRVPTLETISKEKKPDYLLSSVY